MKDTDMKDKKTVSHQVEPKQGGENLEIKKQESGEEMSAFEAYYSSVGAWIFLGYMLLFPLAMVLIAVFSPIDMPIAAILAACLLPGDFLWMYRTSFGNKGIAVEVADQMLVLHKKTDVVIPLREIVRVLISEGNGSFDLIIKARGARYRIHCFVKEPRKKKRELIDLLRSNGILTETYDMSGD